MHMTSPCQPRTGPKLSFKAQSNPTKILDLIAGAAATARAKTFPKVLVVVMKGL
jgi:hypothetical protein